MAIVGARLRDAKDCDYLIDVLLTNREINIATFAVTAKLIVTRMFDKLH